MNMTQEQVDDLLAQFYPVEPGHALKRSKLTLAIRLVLRNQWRGAFVVPSPWAAGS